MKYLIIIFIGLTSLVSFSQNPNTTDFYKILSAKNDELSYTFIPNYSNYFVVLNKKENNYCPKIDSNDSQKIIDIFKRHGIMANDLIFQELETGLPKAQKLAEKRRLLIVVEHPETRYMIFIPDLKMAEKILREIGSELNCNGCFEQLKLEIKKT